MGGARHCRGLEGNHKLEKRDIVVQDDERLERGMLQSRAQYRCRQTG
jgi:hypothetical protein